LRRINRTIGLIFSGFFRIGFFVLTLITLLPAEASKLNRLGYYSVCSFAPMSTTILIILSAMFFLLTYKMFKRIRAREILILGLVPFLCELWIYYS
jgi:peptidoglycan biosynthesis protein MviN/MurJ (putative lipid II flippase)